jgi:hypothetical protein
MDSTDLYNLFRSEIDDNAEPYLWADDEVFGFMDEAQRQFCLETEGIADATNVDVTQIAVVPSTDWVNLHPSIIKIRDVYRLDACADSVEVINREDMPRHCLKFDGAQGPVSRLIIGMEEHKARVHPVSNETITLQLTVFRFPLNTITDTDQALEIQPEHQRALLLWMKHLAYSKQDAETFDKTKAAEFEQRFLAYCQKAKLAAERKRHKPRTVAYGGI